MTAPGHICPSCARALAPEDNFCGRCGLRLTEAEDPRAVAEPALPAWSEERKLATVLFGDIVGFTRISSRLEPDEVWGFANAVFGPLSREVEERGGTVVKYIGDSIMAVFGVPRAREDDATRAVEAALAMRRRLRELADDVESRYGAAISMRIGVNTGLLMVGAVGSGSSLDVMGTTVNVASRVEGVGRPGEVLITEQTRRAVEEAFECESMGLVHFKGIDEPLTVHRVLAERRDAHLLPSPSGSGELFLRQAELTRLTTTLDAVCASRQLRVLKVVGDTGMGKNRILAELSRVALGHAARPAVLGTGTSPFVTTSTLGLIGRVVRHSVGVKANEPVTIARARVIDSIVAAWPAESRVEAEAAAELLANAAGIRGRQQLPAAYESASHQHDRFLAAFSAWVENLARERPLLVVLEDLESADEPSLDLIERLLRGASNLSALVVLAMQPRLEEARPGWLEDLPTTERLELEALGADQLARLVGSILGAVEGTPEDLQERIIQRSEGSPQYAIEIVRLLRDRGVIARAEPGAPERWQAERFEALELPDTVMGLIQARLDALPALEKEVLRRAAVVGKVFWRGAIEHLMAGELEPGQLEAARSALVAKALVRSRRRSQLGGEHELEFRTQALRDASYRSIPTTLRQRWHRRIARWIEGQGELWEDGHAALAAHLEAGGVPEQAREHYLHAARHALSLFDARRAVELYERAIAVWPPGLEPVERATARRELASALILTGRFEEAATALTQVAGELEAAGVAQTSEVYAWLDVATATRQNATGDTDGALRTLDRALARSEGQPASVVLMWLYGQRAARRAARNDLPGARADAEAGLALAEHIPGRSDGWRQARWMLVNALGGVHVRTGRFEEAEHRFGEALATLGSSTNPRGRHVAHVNLGAIAFYRGRFPEAAEAFGSALELSRKFGWTKDVAICLNNLGQTRLAAGQIDEAVGLLEEAVAGTAAALDVLADAGRTLAEALLRKGLPQAAFEQALAAVEAAHQGGHPHFEGEAHAVAMECLLTGARPAGGGDPLAAAETHLGAAEALLTGTGQSSRAEALREQFEAASLRGAAC